MKDQTSTSRKRGQHPNDHKLFSEKWWPVLRSAVEDLSLLLSRGYGSNAALELVGNRYRLNKRQRLAVMRMSASDEEVQRRQARACHTVDLINQPIAIDGFNLLVLLESALSGAFVFRCRDGLYRDISSVHGSYKRVIKTEEAIRSVGETLLELQTGPVLWLLDSPISNSGRLKGLLYEMSTAHGFPWEVELVFNPDKVLAESEAVVISSDGWILDQTGRWYNLGATLMEDHVLEGNVLHLLPVEG